MMTHDTPPVCDYTASDYQSSFWDRGGRAYEDAAEAIAIKRLMPQNGSLLLELGAGAGRNTHRYAGFQRIVLLDYSYTQLEQALARLGSSNRFIYVAADVYRLPFVSGLFDGATMIRTLHHMADPGLAMAQVRSVMAGDATFILEFANKLNLKAILRYWFRRQEWSPFSEEAVEFTRLNYDFHPRVIKRLLQENRFSVERILTVSHFRQEWFKRVIPTRVLAGLDGLFQPTGTLFQLTPSVFIKARAEGKMGNLVGNGFFKCLKCGTALPESDGDAHCPNCRAVWKKKNGIYDFRVKP